MRKLKIAINSQDIAYTSLDVLSNLKPGSCILTFILAMSFVIYFLVAVEFPKLISYFLLTF